MKPNSHCPLLLWLLILHQLISALKAIPLRGNKPWSIILCKYKDVLPEQKSRDYFHNWIVGSIRQSSISNFFSQISNGIYTIEGSQVTPWITLPFTKNGVGLSANQDPLLLERYNESEERLYHKTKELCKQTAEKLGHRLHTRIITAINDEDTAIFCSGTGVLISPKYWLSSALTHEMVHSFHIGHSFSDRRVKVYPYAKTGEYDDKYDLMSTANAYMFPTQFGFSGPGLNGPHLDYLGWLPQYRVLFFGKDGTTDTNIKIASLSIPHGETTDWLLILIPYDRDDPQNFYSIELRTRSALDQGIKQDAAVLIHKVRRQDQGSYFSYLQTDHGGRDAEDYEWVEGEEWATTLNPSTQRGQFIRVTVLNIDEYLGTALIRVTSTFSPFACQKDEVPRNAFTGDALCVSRAEQADVMRMNADADQRRGPASACLPGFVPRLAGEPDQNVCVTAEQRQQVLEQNARWWKYAEFYKDETYGMNACEKGNVWRSLDPYDYVCISKARLEAYIAQNIAASKSISSNRLELVLPTGITADCGQDLEMRFATPQDRVCVTYKERLDAIADNLLSAQKLKHRTFFNGVDIVE